jgi:hypothetical protein
VTVSAFPKTKEEFRMNSSYVRFMRILGTVYPVFFTIIFSEVFTSNLAPVCGILGGCEAAESGDIFNKDINKQKEAVGKDFEKLDEALSTAKLQEARGILEVLEYKIGKMKKNLTKQELESFRQKIDNNKKRVPLTEDSLVAKAFQIMRSNGVDAALQYTQNDLRNHGVAEKKVNAVEKKILKDAPAMQQAFEHQEISRVISLLEGGQAPDSTINPYILKSAQMIIKSKRDSIERIARNQKLKKMEDQERADRARMQQEIDEIAQERKSVEERLAGQNREEEKQKPSVRTVPSPVVAGPADAVMPEQKHAKEAQKPALSETVKNAPEPSDRHQDGVQSEQYAKPSGPDTQADEQAPEIAMALPEQPESKSAQLYLKNLKANQQTAQDMVMGIYDLLEKKQDSQALDQFKRNRDVIARHVDAQVFTLLERNVMQSVMESRTADPAQSSEPEKSGKRQNTINPEIPSAQEHLNRIEGFFRDNKVEAAYAEFKRCEKELKKLMAKSEFKQYKKMIENAYETRHPAR